MLKDKTVSKELQNLLTTKNYLQIPKVGDMVKGVVLSTGKNDVVIDIQNFRPGIVRGKEFLENPESYRNLKVSDPVEAMVLELENEHGYVELSMRFADEHRAWEVINTLLKTGNPVAVKITGANKGGLLFNLEGVSGFVPVSQLSAEHYPKVGGGETAKILEKLRSLVGQTVEVKILDAKLADKKLIASEKAHIETKQRTLVSQYKPGQVVEGEVSAVTDFGAFMKFDNVEGLIHISEIAWQRIDHPSDILSVGQKVKAEVVNIDGSKIYLSLRRLAPDPWKNINEKYQIGQVVKGKVIKTNPFGLFVELDQDIHGLAHVSELSTTPIASPEEVGKIGDVLEFKIISIEPEFHRLGLSVKALTAPAAIEPAAPEPAITSLEEKK